MTQAGTLKNLFVKLTAAPGGAASYRVTIRLNGANTALVVNVTGAATTGSDTVDTVAYAAFDLVSAEVNLIGGPGPSTVIASVQK
jgi:hypothetical protein